MKKTIATLAFLLIAGVIFAQEGAKIGFRASPLIGWATIVDDSSKTKPEGLETNAALGFSFDFVFTYGFSDNVMLRTGLNIASKNAKSTTNLSAFNTNLTQRVNFTAIEVPIGFKFRSPEIGDSMYIVGHFGANPEINVQNKVFTDGTVLGVPVSSEQVDVDGIRPFTASFVPGAGLDWEFDWGMLEFAVTYHWGLLSYTDPDKFGGQKSRMNYIALNLGYFF